jgi:serine/threonine protein kinase
VRRFDVTVPTPLNQICRATTQLNVDVARCHARGIIHRDIKLSNIIVTERGELRLIDFDVAAYRGAGARGRVHRHVGILGVGADPGISPRPHLLGVAGSRKLGGLCRSTVIGTEHFPHKFLDSRMMLDSGLSRELSEKHDYDQALTRDSVKSLGIRPSMYEECDTALGSVSSSAFQNLADEYERVRNSPRELA